MPWGGGVHSSFFKQIATVENLLAGWYEFVCDKRCKKDIQIFQLRLMAHILTLYTDLCNKTYRHGPYQHLTIADPKPRDIHKATVRDRLLHHAVYRVLYPFFEKRFIADSFSCRLGKGTHRALNRFLDFGKRVSFSHTKTCWVLKCDIRKFFASIDHSILLQILSRFISDPDVILLLGAIIGSFNSGTKGVGLPLGNLTSQLFVNIYMDEFDQFVKHALNIKHYIRYADDFVILSQNRENLVSLIPPISDFLSKKLYLELHPDKVSIITFSSGVDFLGWVHFPTHRVLRTSTKRRMFSRVNERNLSSYTGLLKHGNTFFLQEEIQALTTRF